MKNKVCYYVSNTTYTFRNITFYIINLHKNRCCKNKIDSDWHHYNKKLSGTFAFDHFTIFLNKNKAMEYHKNLIEKYSIDKLENKCNCQ